MATIGQWVVQLGNAGAIRNAAVSVAERRALEARLDATMRRFSEEVRDERSTPGLRGGVAS